MGTLLSRMRSKQEANKPERIIKKGPLEVLFNFGVKATVIVLIVGAVCFVVISLCCLIWKNIGLIAIGAIVAILLARSFSRGYSNINKDEDPKEGDHHNDNC
jgi:hypothetical protein